MSRSPLRTAVEAQLARIGSDLRSFLQAGVDRGKSPTSLAEDLQRVTGIEVSYRSVYRWIDAYGIEKRAAS